MSPETRPFDPARYLDNDEARAAYITEALETEDPTFIANALEVVTRARALTQGSCETTLPGENLHYALGSDGPSDLRQLLAVIRGLGLRLTVRPASH